MTDKTNIHTAEHQSRVSLTPSGPCLCPPLSSFGLHSSLKPVLPSSPCWLGPSVAPAWIAARPRSSCHCCAACAARPPAWWGAARPEIRLGPLPCTLPGPLTGWAGEESGSRAPGTKLSVRQDWFCFIMDANMWSFLIIQLWFHLRWKALKLPH